MKISVVIYAHNAVATLSKAINSLLDQSYQADEIIVVDDGSTDATSESTKVFEEVSLLRQKHMGKFSARNNGVMMASNPWIAFLDATETWDEDHLKKQVAFHQKSKALKISVYSAEGPFLMQDALKKGRVEASNVMIQQKLFDQLGGFDEAFEVGEDDELWIRAIESK